MMEKKHTVAILALEGFVPFDLAIPYNIFSLARLSDGTLPYEVFFCSVKENCSNREFHLATCQSLEVMKQAQTIIIPGIENALSFVDHSVFKALRDSVAQGARLASICTGACVLAASGILDGLKATTHWEMAEELAQKYPAITVEPDVLFVDNGNILTSAGLASGIDLCLHMIRKDYGAATAATVARFFVMPLEREGGHPQRMPHNVPSAEDNLTSLLLWLMENLHAEHTLQSLAVRAGMSLRTLNRKFKEQMNTTPMAWIMASRIRRAQTLLESTTLSVEQIATTTGFTTAATLRERFRQSVGVTPTGWRKTYAS